MVFALNTLCGKGNRVEIKVLKDKVYIYLILFTCIQQLSKWCVGVLFCIGAIKVRFNMYAQFNALLDI